MQVQVIGKGNRREGVSKKNGKPYDFTPIYGIRSAVDGEGHQGEEIMVSHLSNMNAPDIREIHIGDIINVSYDKNGFLEEISVLEKSTKAQKPAQ